MKRCFTIAYAVNDTSTSTEKISAEASTFAPGISGASALATSETTEKSVTPSST